MIDDFSQCFVSNSRMAARAITRRYDRELRGQGISATQLSLLAAIRLLPGHTVSELAEARGFDRTTLTRNLDRLEANGLVSSRAAERGNGRHCSITPKGEALLQALLPIWRRAQAEMCAEIGAEAFAESTTMLKRLARV